MKFYILILAIFPLWAMDDGLFVREYGLDKPTILLHTDKWGVLPSKIDKDKFSFKNQPRHIIDWERLDQKNWLDFRYWKAQRASRDQYPDWRLRFRDSSHTERVGQVIQCIKYCMVFKSEQEVGAQYMTRLHEGDEFSTGEDSYAWITLVDGTLIRVSPNTSISFNDINFSKKVTQHFIRLNYGHMYLEPRVSGKFKIENLAETDGGFLPLMMKKANREYYEIKEFRKLDDQESLNYDILDNPGHRAQYKKLNELIDPNNQPFKRDSHYIVSTSNTTLLSRNSAFEFWHGSFNISLVKKIGNPQGLEEVSEVESSLSAYFRGFNNEDSQELEDGKWFEMDIHGKSLSEVSDKSVHRLDVLELFIKRIPSIRIARELFLRKNYQYNFFKEEEFTEKTLAQDFGHRLWDLNAEGDLEKREKFLLQYIRRVETANLHSVEKLKIKYSNEKMGNSYSNFAIAENLAHLKWLGSPKASMIKEMTDTQYYVWMIKYGNKHNKFYTGKCIATKKGVIAMDLSSVQSTDC